MKKIIIILLSFLFLNVSAQKKQGEIKTSSFKVAGNCEQCKNRIENAADIKGVKLAVWDVKTQILKVTYRTDKVTEAEIKKVILNSGHDADTDKASDATYNKLPDCCKYRDKKCVK